MSRPAGLSKPICLFLNITMAIILFARIPWRYSRRPGQLLPFALTMDKATEQALTFPDQHKRLSKSLKLLA